MKEHGIESMERSWNPKDVILCRDKDDKGNTYPLPLHEWMKRYGIKRRLRLDGGYYVFHFKEQEYRTDHSQFLTYLMQELAWVGARYAKADVENHVRAFALEEQKRQRHRLISSLAFITANDEAEKLVKIVTGSARPEDVAAVKSFVWQVKRKMRGLPVTNHLMVIFKGKQGCGKSEMIKRLCRPIERFAKTVNLSEVCDPRSFRIMQDNFVLVADELAGGDKSDMNYLKSLITQEKVTARVLGLNEIAEVPQNATFIGSTNIDTNEIFRDNSGNRRFYQIDCVDRFDFDAINGIDYQRLWQGIDEAEANPVEAHLAAIQAIQERQRSVSIEEQFLVEEELLPDDESPTYFCLTKRLYAEFGVYLRNRQWRSTPPGVTVFGRRISQFLKVGKTRSGRGFYVAKKIDQLHADESPAFDVVEGGEGKS